MKTTIVKFGLGVATFGLLVGGGAGCGMDATDEGVESTRSALVPTQDFVDPSGLVTLRVKTCSFVGPSQSPFAFCQVDPGFVLVGGGAEVEYPPLACSGGLLTTSMPNGPSWVARSKDHVAPCAHRLRAYAVGMKLDGMSSDILQSLVKVSSVTSSTASNAPSATVKATLGNWVLSGGATTNPPAGSPGQLLTGSFPETVDGLPAWTATSKAHQLNAPMTVTSFAITIPVCLGNQWTAHPNYCLTVSPLQAQGTSYSGYSVTQLSVPAGTLPLGVGGLARYTGAGRMLTQMVPLFAPGLPGAAVTSKDHNVADPIGVTAVWTMSIRATPH